MGSMMGGAGMGVAMFAVMGASALLQLALLVATVLGIVWLARRVSAEGHRPPGEAEVAGLPPHHP